MSSGTAVQGSHDRREILPMGMAMHTGGRLLVNPLSGRYNAIRFPAVRS
jgi:hypothetical protein